MSLSYIKYNIVLQAFIETCESIKKSSQGWAHL